MQPASAAATELNNDVNDAEAPRQKKERQGAEEDVDSVDSHVTNKGRHNIFFLLLFRLCRGAGIVVNPSVCAYVCLSVCLSVCEHISRTAGPIGTIFCVPIPCGRGSGLFRRRCVMLCTSVFAHDVLFCGNGTYGVV